jgi:hypothetical protein
MKMFKEAKDASLCELMHILGSKETKYIPTTLYLQIMHILAPKETKYIYIYTSYALLNYRL